MIEERSEQRAGASAAPELERAYRPTEVEPLVYERWLAADVFAPDGAGSRADPALPPFVVIQPPPNVTGALHMGHALTATVEDLMVRRARMQGRPTLWLPGSDHASIAAQFVLDGLLAAEGETRESLGRERYLARMWEFMGETRSVMSAQHRRLGASADWGRERFTMDERSARAVRTAFKRLHDDGLVYRTEALINWCPGCRTSLSDLEVIPKPEQGTLWFVRYHLIRDDGAPDPAETVTVATTRPETILGDTAVAVHPEDDRYRTLVGRRVLIPFVDRIVPIIADPVVERDFGTGAVKITPAHDHDDYETGRRHRLPAITVMDDEARITDAGGPYAGLSREEARRRIVGELERRGDLAEARPHEMLIGRCQRSNDIAEPRLKTQWFVRTRPMADRAMAAVREGRTRFVPSRFEKVFTEWMDRIHDWNVSRQLWWGHRIPAWYCPDGHVTVSDAADGPDRCGACGRTAAELRQDEDIFDTWFSSGLWPFSTLGWPEATPDLGRFYPGSVLETGYDIIFFWVARMMMLGEWLMGREPFGTVYLHGMMRDPYGQKMSKTRGNVVDPLGVIDEVGADALRLALVLGSTPGNDQRLGSARLEGARNFANKLWNAARFVLGARPEGGEAAHGALPEIDRLGPAEHWILNRCAATTEAVDRAYETFGFGEVARLLHEAIWSDFCDWYLEIAKVTLATTDSRDRRTATWQVLAWVLDRYLRLLHPLMPHLTEELWGRLPHAPEEASMLIVARWPNAAEARRLADPVRAAAVERWLELIRAVRTVRSEAGIEPATRLEAALVVPDLAMQQAHQPLRAAIDRLARVNSGLAASGPAASDLAASLVALAGDAEAHLRRSGADVDRERARVRRELDDAMGQLEAARTRLENPSFVDRAPAAVVEGARARVAELEDRIERLAARASG